LKMTPILLGRVKPCPHPTRPYKSISRGGSIATVPPAPFVGIGDMLIRS